jgi:hypothetical protein
MHKSDIQGAYRNIPMAPLWQIKQAIALEDWKHIDGCNCFGCCGSYYVYFAFISLVCWIAEHVKMIPHLKCYIDDNCSFARLGDVKYYPPYNCYFPSNQTKLLELWDEVGLPHEHKKQIYGPIIPFIGFDVDPNTMTVSISPERKQNLVDKVLDFAKAGKRHSLKEYQSLAGYINRSLAVFLLLKPSLSAMYAKMMDKTKLLASIRVNNAVRNELLWFTKHALKSNSIFFLKAVAWDPSNDLSNTSICYTDACPTGIAYWFPELSLGFQCHIPQDNKPHHIFYFEALAVTCAILDKSYNTPWLVVYSDNQNTVDVWHSLKAHAPYNELLILAIDELIRSDIEARVLYVLGEANVIADALSCFNNKLALKLAPNLQIISFQPPHDTLGAPKK